MSVKVTPITDFRKIEDLAEGGNLYVVNNSDQQNQRSRGNVVLDIAGEDGRSFAVVVPDTWIPTNLATYAEPRLFMKANTFRAMLRTRDLIVISNEEALAILDKPEAREELKKVNEYRRAHNSSMHSSGILAPEGGDGTFTINTGSNRAPEIARTSDDLSNLRAIPQSARPEVPENPDDNVLHRLVSDFNTGSLTEEQVLETLRTINPSLDAVKMASGTITNSRSRVFEVLGDMISGGSSGNASVAYRGPTPPPGF